MPSPTISPHLDNHLERTFGKANYVVSGAQATMTSANINMAQLAQLVDVAAQTKHDVSIVSGVVTIKPR